MKNKIWAILLIGTALLTTTACARPGTGEADDKTSAGRTVDQISNQMAGGAADKKTARNGDEADGELAADSLAAKYRDSVFLGDSITEGLSFHDVLDEKNVLAGAGKTAEFAIMNNDVDQLASRKPERVFIQLGSDDILWPTDQPQEHSLKNYAQLIDLIRAKLPQAAVTLLSVAPVSEAALQKEPRYANIQAYNEGLRKLAEQKKAAYVDLTSLVREHVDLYDSDGIHFKKDFYPILLLDLERQSK